MRKKSIFTNFNIRNCILSRVQWEAAGAYMALPPGAPVGFLAELGNGAYRRSLGVYIATEDSCSVVAVPEGAVGSDAAPIEVHVVGSADSQLRFPFIKVEASALDTAPEAKTWSKAMQFEEAKTRSWRIWQTGGL